MARILLFWFFVCVTAQAEDFRVQHGPYLTNMTTNSVTIVWFTSKQSAASVEMLDENGSWQEVMEQKHGLKSSYSLMHKIEITGLKSGEVYQYRTISREIKNPLSYRVLFGKKIISEVNQFEVFSQKREKFSVYVVNDHHEEQKRLRILLSLFSFNPGDFVVFNGDMLNFFSHQNQLFDSVIDPASDYFAKKIPLVYVRGNHELRGQQAREFNTYFPTSTSAPYYYFRQGEVEFFVLDSGEDKPDNHFEYSGLVNFDAYRKEQILWFKRVVQESEKSRFRIVFMHMPLYGGDGWYGEKQNRLLWEDLLNQHGIDLMISGHTHKLAWIPPRKDVHSYPILINGSKNITRLNMTTKGVTIFVSSQEGKKELERTFEF